MQINPKAEENSLNTINNNEVKVPNNEDIAIEEQAPNEIDIHMEETRCNIHVEEDITIKEQPKTPAPPNPIEDQTECIIPDEEDIQIKEQPKTPAPSDLQENLVEDEMKEQTQCKIPVEEDITIKEQPKTPAPSIAQDNPIEDEIRLFLSEESGDSCDVVLEKDPLDLNICNKGPQSDSFPVVVHKIDETNPTTNLNSEADKAKNNNTNQNMLGLLTENKLENLQPIFSLPTQEIITSMFSTFNAIKKKMNSTKEENITKSKTKISCDYCGKNFMFKSRLMQHLATHSSERPFTCSRCPKAFSRKDSLMAHEITHTNVKPYKCDRCVAHFTRRHSLKKHYYVHTNEKSYSCELCLKSFGRRDNYIMHLKSHKGVKPFKCEECPKAFVRSDVLRRHKKTHENDPRNYICAICFKAYSRADSLRTHLKQHVKKMENSNAK